jgi:hypothetical protein
MDNLPILHTSFSILCHLVYLQNFSETWPLIDLTSIPFIASCILVISDHLIWFYYFARLTSEARRLRTYRGAAPYAPGFTEIATFFGLCVWLSPLFLFLSLSANDNALPIMSAGKRISCSLMLQLLTVPFSVEPPPGSPLGFATTPSNRGRVSLIRSAFSLLSFDKIPGLRQPTRRGTADGLIAPSTPNLPPSRPVSPLPTLSPRPSYSGPPRSPNLHGQELDIRHEQHLSPNPNFKLREPPSRRATEGPASAVRRVATDSPTPVGLGLRRTSSYVAVDEDRSR